MVIVYILIQLGSMSQLKIIIKILNYYILYYIVQQVFIYKIEIYF